MFIFFMIGIHDVDAQKKKRNKKKGKVTEVVKPKPKPKSKEKTIADLTKKSVKIEGYLQSFKTPLMERFNY